MEPSFTLTIALALVGSSILSVFAVLCVSAYFDRRKADRRPESVKAMFLLEGDTLVDANAGGRALIEQLKRRLPSSANEVLNISEAELLTDYLTAQFSGFEEKLGAIKDESNWRLNSAAPLPLLLQGKRLKGALHLTLSPSLDADRSQAASKIEIDPLSWRLMNEELETLRRVADLAPTPAWRADAEGRILWANGAYLQLLSETREDELMVWPLGEIFQPLKSGLNDGLPQRQSIQLPSSRSGKERVNWYDLRAFDQEDGQLFFALPADEAEQAESARKKVVQMLGVTFATLPIGLAVFDRMRRLHSFNPALVDLTELEPEFLANRPTLKGFLNRLHEMHVLPVLRDPNAWTERLLSLEAASASGASGGVFEESWPLPDGRIYRISARPQPDGALALLFEDITSDVHLKRSFRAELDASRAALDMSSTGLAVFGPKGDLVMTNSAFDQLWEFDASDTLIGLQFRQAVANWRMSTTGGEALWSQVLSLAFPGSSEFPVQGELRLLDGTELWLQARRAAGGRVIVSFSEAASRQHITATNAPRLRRRATA